MGIGVIFLIAMIIMRKKKGKKEASGVDAESGYEGVSVIGGNAITTVKPRTRTVSYLIFYLCPIVISTCKRAHITLCMQNSHIKIRRMA